MCICYVVNIGNWYVYWLFALFNAGVKFPYYKLLENSMKLTEMLKIYSYECGKDQKCVKLDRRPWIYDSFNASLLALRLGAACRHVCVVILLYPN